MKVFPDQERTFESLKRNEGITSELAIRKDTLFPDQIRDMVKIKTPNDYRDFLRKLRAAVAGKSEPKLLTANKEEVTKIFFILVEETCFGEVKELKGLLLEVMKIYRSCLPYINEVF